MPIIKPRTNRVRTERRVGHLQEAKRDVPTQNALFRSQLRAQSTLDSAPDRADDREELSPRAEAIIAATSVTLRMLRFPAVRERTGLSRSTVWRLERCGSFPRHRRLSLNAVAWVEQEIVEWLSARAAEAS